MPQLTVEQRVFVVRTYYESHSFAEVQRLFRLQFPDRNPPDKANIWRNVQKYLNNGTSWNMNSKKCGRKRTGRSDDNIDAVQHALINNPEGIKYHCVWICWSFKGTEQIWQYFLFSFILDFVYFLIVFIERGNSISRVLVLCPYVLIGILQYAFTPFVLRLQSSVHTF